MTEVYIIIESNEDGIKILHGSVNPSLIYFYQFKNAEEFKSELERDHPNSKFFIKKFKLEDKFFE